MASQAGPKPSEGKGRSLRRPEWSLKLKERLRRTFPLGSVMRERREEAESGREQDAEVRVWSQETKSPQ